MDSLDEAWELPDDTALDPIKPDKKPCPDCGKELTWLKDGSRPRAHRCEPKTKLPEPGPDHPSGQPQPVSKVTADLVIEKFVETRDTISELKKKFDSDVAEMKDTQERRLLWLRGEMDRLGLKSFKGDSGTAFLSFKDSATVADREVFLSWVSEDWESRSGYLENRVSKTAVKQRLEDGELLPPGVNYTKIQDVKIRRS